MLDTKTISEKREYFIYLKKEILYTEKVYVILKSAVSYIKETT
jgi:hypothetical protein